ncbi:MAG: DUF2309 domain-containing protein [Bacteroidetes bacterium]|nr:DUF2309 domain-containing protein [Bacteroidota bacterium]
MNAAFALDHVIAELKHYLPAQASLKDFIHHNTLHSFQKDRFFEGIEKASLMFGYRTLLTLSEYRDLFQSNKISRQALRQVISEYHPEANLDALEEKFLRSDPGQMPLPRIGLLRATWKKCYRIDLDAQVQPLLFRVLCNYLDQGISVWNLPTASLDFLSSLREIEKLSRISIFRTARCKGLFLDPETHLEDLLKILVGKEEYFEQYLFDQQFAHPGWSGFVSVVEDNPATLLDKRSIRLADLIFFECLLEIDVLDQQLGDSWSSVSSNIQSPVPSLFDGYEKFDLWSYLKIWQEAFERSYHDQVLAGITTLRTAKRYSGHPSFQALFCIDDRECSLRRYLEDLDPACQTYGTPGFFGVEFFFRPENGKFLTKLCPAPVTPGYVIAEEHSTVRQISDPHFRKSTHGLFRGWLISQTLGFWSAVKLFLNVLRPSMSPAVSYSFRHMDKASTLTINHRPRPDGTPNKDRENPALQIGFQQKEQADRVENLLKSIGLVSDFAPLVYVVGHGASSVNNPHYAAYDCGACSGRAGSVNARVICAMANDAGVRSLLRERGIDIPGTTRFVGGLHDTTRDELLFFDESEMDEVQLRVHKKNELIFTRALDFNARERSRRFASIDTSDSLTEIHSQILVRSVSLFEPRPELNHATNALCIVGRRSLTDGLFLDRRSFMNSYDYQIDPDGKYLFGILKAAAPVCGGINLEYFFSRTDNRKLGAGTKLPHNVMGLFGVANGIDGDLRPGLPSQMIEVHDPLRLMIIVEHEPGVVLSAIQRNEETYEWFKNEWVLLTVVQPTTKNLFRFRDGQFMPYTPCAGAPPETNDIGSLLFSTDDNIPVHIIKS